MKIPTTSQERREQLVTRELYDHYRKTRRKVAKEIDQYKLFEKAVKGLLSQIHRMVEEAPGGLYLKDFGYIYVTTKTIRKKEKNGILKKSVTIKKINTELFSKNAVKWNYIYYSAIRRKNNDPSIEYKYMREDIEYVKAIENAKYYKKYK
jgi:hypothetical protein